GRARHRAALPPRPPRRGARDHRRLRLLRDLQLRLLPAVRRRRARAALHDHAAAVPGLPARARAAALARISIVAWTLVTITHPLVGYENETAVWTRLLSKGEFQPTIATALGAGR